VDPAWVAFVSDLHAYATVEGMLVDAVVATAYNGAVVLGQIAMALVHSR